MRIIDADELKRSISQNNKIPRIFSASYKCTAYRL